MIIIYSKQRKLTKSMSSLLGKFSFSGVEIEIRNINDPIIQAGLTTNYSYNFGGKLTVIYWLIIST